MQAKKKRNKKTSFAAGNPMMLFFGTCPRCVGQMRKKNARPQNAKTNFSPNFLKVSHFQLISACFFAVAFCKKPLQQHRASPHEPVDRIFDPWAASAKNPKNESKHTAERRRAAEQRLTSIVAVAARSTEHAVKATSSGTHR